MIAPKERTTKTRHVMYVLYMYKELIRSPKEI